VIAYLDANSGSLIASAIAAGFAGIAVVFKMGFSRTLGFFSPKKRREAKEALAAEKAAQAEDGVSSAPIEASADPTPVSAPAGDDA
jgi:hypothetical protein